MHALLRLIRPRTLPLALAAVCCGNAIAWHSSPASWRGSVFLLSLLTAMALQIVSNIANDYGDGIRGTDRHRAPDAPERLTASGQIPLLHIRRLLVASVLAALLLGGALIALSLRHPQQWLAFLLLGSLALAAALICYAALTPQIPSGLFWLTALPLATTHLHRLQTATNPAAAGRELPHIVRLALAVNLLFGSGLLLDSILP